MTCRFLRDNQVCRIASEIAACDAKANPSACAFCTEQCEPKRSVNNVTVSLALAASGKERAAWILNKYRHLLRSIPHRPKGVILNELETENGVGSQLWRLLSSLGVEHKPTCSCINVAQNMNRLGPEGCRRRREHFVAAMQNNAKSYGWGDVAMAAVNAVKTGLAWRINPLDPYGSLLDESIRRAESAKA